MDNRGAARMLAVQGAIEEHDVVVRWARCRNTVMKVSAVPDQHRYPHRDVRPIIRTLTDAFGADCMICGGGFSAEATGESYRGCREQVAEVLAHHSVRDRARIFGGTAESCSASRPPNNTRSQVSL